ncbi:restriction endonuclease subunit S [Psychrobacter immobilis]|uniref:restriction endonuclease subunit S n=1 Tax=Psychrobacter immobilis TaxID=498 RepID=UPI003FD0B6F5
MIKNEASKVPENWQECVLSDILYFQNGHAFKSHDFIKNNADEELIPLVKQSQLKGSQVILDDCVFLPSEYLDKYSDFIIRKGDILIGMSGSIGKMSFYNYDYPSLLNQRVGKLELYSKDIFNNNFFGYLLLNLEQNIQTIAKGMGVQNVSSKDIEKIIINLPPINEQNRIVDKIETLFSEVDAGIENLTLAKRQLEQYRQSLLKHAFEGKLTAKWREEYAKNHGKSLPSADELLKQVQTARQDYYDQQIADWEQAIAAWEEQGKEGTKPRKPSKPYLDKLATHSENQLLIPLGSIIEQPKYGTSKKCTYDQSQNSIGVIRIPNINSNGLIDLTDMKFAEFDNDEVYEYKLEKDDLLIIRSNGSPSIVGRCAVVNEKDLTYIYAGYLIRLRPIKSLIDSDFLNLALKSVKLRSEIENKAKSTSGVNNINAKEIQSLELPYFDMLEQTRIVETVLPKIQLIENQLNDIDIALRKSDILKQSILYKAFQGKLVPQDLNDPPASELLVQIKAEREAKALAEKQAKQDKAASKSKAKAKSAKTPKKSKKDEQITLPLQ